MIVPVLAAAASCATAQDRPPYQLPPVTAQRLTNQGWFVHVTGDGVAAEPALRRALELALQIVGQAHADAMAGAQKHAGFLIRQNRPDEALGLVRAALGDLRRDWRTPVRWRQPGPSAGSSSAR